MLMLVVAADDFVQSSYLSIILLASLLLARFYTKSLLVLSDVTVTVGIFRMYMKLMKLACYLDGALLLLYVVVQISQRSRCSFVRCLAQQSRSFVNVAAG
mmetsp:Transcript_12787/g.19347  ORF Transcript_12787/g.19347 Transcript_12787/m.19347 type:complete len:100 (-) Transcript_12787:36-335(-)